MEFPKHVFLPQKYHYFSSRSLQKNEQGLIDYQDMLQFMDTTKNPIDPMESVSVKVSIINRDNFNLNSNIFPQKINRHFCKRSATFFQTSLWWASEKDPNRGAGLDWCSFLKDLDINEDDPAPQAPAIPS